MLPYFNNNTQTHRHTNTTMTIGSTEPVVHEVKQSRHDAHAHINMYTVTRRGAEIPKSNTAAAARARRELTVAPVSLNDPFPKKFRVYAETADALIVPLHWAAAALGQPNRDARPPGEPFEFSFNGSLREDLRQPEAVAGVLKTWGHGLPTQKIRGAMLCLPAGFGKCLAPETPVLLYNGCVVTADSLEPGMQMMGPDSTPRNVLNVSRGTEMMYELRPTKGDAWRCNESHILSLKLSGHGYIKTRANASIVSYYDTCSNIFTSKSFKTSADAAAFVATLPRDPIVDITVKDYVALPKTVQENLKLFKTGPIDFPARPDPACNPYILGAWLGDGTSTGPDFTFQDNELYDEINRRALPNEMALHQKISPSAAKRCFKLRYNDNDERKGHINPFMRTLQKYNLINNKHIPADIKYGSRRTRLDVLAGLLDTDGHLAGNCYEITQKKQVLANDIVFVARSLGFAANIKQVRKTCVKPDGNRVTGTYHQTVIYGEGLETIPVALARKMAAVRLQIKDARRSGFTCIPVGRGAYVGPVLDADHRYVLGDFTVTHNTSTALYLASVVKKRMLVIVHKSFLADQWAERVAQFLPGARVTRVQGDVCDTSGDVVIAMLQTLVSRKYPASTFDACSLLVADEVHHIGAAVFSQAMLGLCLPYTLGLSATPDRKDGLSRVVGWFMGDMAFRLHRENQASTRVDVVKYASARYDEPPPVNRRGDVCFTSIITILANDEARTRTIAQHAARLAADKRDVLVLSHRREHCKALASAIEELGVPSVATYLGGDKAAPDTQVIVATYSLTSEGFDMPRLNALVLATPASDVDQSCGRVMRGSSASSSSASSSASRGALIVDVVDEWGITYAQAAKRRAFYKKSGFVIGGAQALDDADPKPKTFAFVDDD